jgi:hypothetical protein
VCLLSDFEPAGLLLFIPWRVGAERRAGSGNNRKQRDFFCICNSNGHIDCVAVNRDFYVCACGNSCKGARDFRNRSVFESSLAHYWLRRLASRELINPPGLDGVGVAYGGGRREFRVLAV